MGRGELDSPHDVELMGPLVTRDHWYVLASHAHRFMRCTPGELFKVWVYEVCSLLLFLLVPSSTARMGA